MLAPSGLAALTCGAHIFTLPHPPASPPFPPFSPPPPPNPFIPYFETGFTTILIVLAAMCVIPVLYVACNGDALRKRLWKWYNTEARQERRDERKERERTRRAPTLGSAI